MNISTHTCNNDNKDNPIPRLDLYPVCLPPRPLLGGPREYPHGDRVPQRVGHHVALRVEHDLVVELLGHRLHQPGVLGFETINR